MTRLPHLRRALAVTPSALPACSVRVQTSARQFRTDLRARFTRVCRVTLILFLAVQSHQHSLGRIHSSLRHRIRALTSSLRCLSMSNTLRSIQS